MARFLKIEHCSQCPFVGHSGAFTPGGLQYTCDCRGAKNPNAESPWGRPVLNPANPTKMVDEIPQWCPMEGASEPVAKVAPSKDGSGLISVDWLPSSQLRKLMYGQLLYTGPVPPCNLRKLAEDCFAHGRAYEIACVELGGTPPKLDGVTLDAIIARHTKGGTK